MKRRLAENTLFFREFVRNFHTTGAVLPSGRQLAKCLSRFVADHVAGPKRILEVGPGTGAVTRQIVARMNGHDRLDLVELNKSFVDQLRRRFASEPSFQRVADRSQVLHCAIEELPQDRQYDLIISGLPLNNFAAAEVEQILAALMNLLTPGGRLSFFEYIAIRSVRSIVSRGAERERLQGISRAMQAVLKPHEVRRDAVLLNVPPAWVHHLTR